MSVTKEFDFDLQEEVYFLAMECKGRINQICILSLGIEYEVRYFHNGDLKKAWLLASELRKINNV